MSDLTFNQLKKATTSLAKDVTKAADAIRSHAQLIDEHARDTASVAEMIAAVKVDTATIGETRELAKILAGVSEASIAYASASDNTAKAAKAAHDQTNTTHGGIQEAFNRSPVDASETSPEWFRQD